MNQVLQPPDRRLVAVLFVDMAGSVATTYGLDPEDTAELMDRVVQVMIDTVANYGGVVNGLLGDGVLAVFGLERVREDDTERAVLAALDIRDALHQMSLDATAGVEAGEVYVGVLAGHQQLRGSTLNLAARLQAAATAGEILVGPSACRLLVDAFTWTERPVRVKGVNVPVVAGVVTGLRPAPALSSGLMSPLVGRARELQLLEQAVQALQGAGGSVAFVHGVAGVGKSRLLSEFRRGVATSASIDWLEGQCQQWRTSNSGSPLLDMLRRRLRDDADGGAMHDALARLETRGLLTGTQSDETEAALDTLLSRAAPDESVQHSPSDRTRARAVRAVVTLLRAWASERPLVLALEDLHWGDTLTRDIVQQLSADVREVPLLLVISSRDDPEYDPNTWFALLHHDWTLDLHVEPLSEAEAEQLVTGLSGAMDASPALSQVVRRAEGNPLFLEELTQDVLEVSSPNGTSSLPATIRSVISARVDRVPVHGRALLGTASCLGRTFSEDLLETVVAREDAPIDMLVDFERRALLTRVSDAGRWKFRHALIHETVYESLPRRRRAVVHRHIGRVLEQLHDDPSHHLEELAHHYERSDDHHKAVEYLVRAGERAAETHLTDEAKSLHEQAITRLTSVGDADTRPDLRQWHARAHLGVAQSTLRVGRLAPAHEALERALDLATGTLLEPVVRQHQASVYELQLRYEDAKHELESAIEVLAVHEAAGNRSVWRRSWMLIHFALVRIAYWQQDFERLVQLIPRVRPFLAGATTEEQYAFHAMLHRHLIARDGYRPADEATAEANAALAAARATRDTALTADGNFVVGFTSLLRENTTGALEHLDAASSGASQVRDAHLTCRCLAYIAVARRLQGHVRQTADAATRALESATRLQMPQYVAVAEANLGWASYQTGEIGEASGRLEDALNTWIRAEPGFPLRWLALWPLLAIAVQSGQLDVAYTHARMLLDPKQQQLHDELREQLGDALDAAEGGSIQTCLRHLERACVIARNHHYT